MRYAPPDGTCHPLLGLPLIAHSLHHREIEKMVKGTCCGVSETALPCQVP